MPLTKIKNPETFEEMDLDKAPGLLEEAGILPLEVTNLLVEDAQRGSPAGAIYVSPSIIDPTTVCQRSVITERFKDYAVDPATVWAAKEGTIWHSALCQGAGDMWMNEIALPADPENEGDDWRPGHGDDRHHPLTQRCEDGKLRLEVWPGVLMRCRIDRVDNDWQKITDFKTQRPAKRDYGLKQGWTNQMNIYKKFVQMLRGTDPDLVVWRIYRGAYNVETAFRRFEVPILPEGPMNAIGKFGLLLHGRLKEAKSIVDSGGDLDAFIKTIPMDGEQIWGGKRCDYCSVRPLCHKIQGLVTF